MATIHFYKADYARRELIINSKGQQETKDTNLKYNELENDIKQIIIRNMNEKKCVLLEDPPEWSLIEVLKFGKNIGCPIKCNNIKDSDFIFGRIGRKKDISEIGKRNRKNFEPSDIDKSDDEDIEVYTYFYIFFEKENEKVAIAYLTSRSAPNIRKLENLMSKYHSDKKRVLEINPIITKDIGKVLKKKDVINAFSYKIALPMDKILASKDIGLTEDAFDEFYNVKSAEVVVTITAQRNTNLLKDKSKIEDYRDHLYKTHGSKVKDCLAKAKNNGGNLLPYHFLDNEFIEKATFKYTSDDGEKRVEEIEETLISKYMSHRGELLEYMR